MLYHSLLVARGRRHSRRVANVAVLFGCFRFEAQLYALPELTGLAQAVAAAELDHIQAVDALAAVVLKVEAARRDDICNNVVTLIGAIIQGVH